MEDPIGSYEEIRKNFITYVKTAFGTKFPDIEKERENILKKNGVLAQEPWIEVIPRYKKSKYLDDVTLDDLGQPDDFTRVDLERFKDFVSCGLVDRVELYEHQLEMLKRGLAKNNLVVTAGTGSGKTESFLMPIIAQLVKEANSWSAPDPVRTNQGDWWRNKSYLQEFKGRKNLRNPIRVSQRSNETRPQAMRALILYPMNALVEDQLTRIRQALDSPKAHEWYKNNGGNRFYFGRYTGQTPVSGDEFDERNYLDRDRTNRLTEELKEIEQTQIQARKYDDKYNNGKADVRYFFPSLDGSEMRSRWDMQEYPPDILITNFSMLSIMLMRRVDNDMFAKTREWLETNENAIFNLVFDELHLYRGTAGTEVAYLVRLLLNRLGLTPESNKLRILSSSASLDDKGKNAEASANFLREFFGTKVTIVPGKWRSFERHDEKIPWKPFSNLADAWELEDAQDKNIKVKEAYRQIASALNGGQPPREDPFEDLERAINKEDSILSRAMISGCWESNSGQPTTISLSDYGQSLFGKDTPNEFLQQAVRGLFIARARIEFEKDGQGKKRVETDKMPSFRFHWFFKNLEGLWASIDPLDTEDEFSVNTPERTVGQLFLNQEIFTKKNNRILELLYCEQCGAVFFGGAKRPQPNNSGWALFPVDPNLENAPDKPIVPFVENKNYLEYGIFWSSGNQNLKNGVNSNWRVKTKENRGHANCEWIPMQINPASGEIKHSGKIGGKSIDGYFYNLTPVNSQAKDFMALPSRCPACGEDYKKRKKNSPIRGFRTGFTKVSQTMAKEMFYQLPEDDDRKLVIFSDSREDAARLANDMERYHYSETIRDTIYNRLYESCFGKAEALECLVKNEPFTLLASGYINENQDEKETIEGIADAMNKNLEDINERLLRRLVEELQSKGKTIIEAKSRAKIPMEDFITYENPVVINELKNLGINPAGVDHLVQEFKADAIWKNWWEYLNFKEKKGTWDDRLTDAQRGRMQNVFLPRVRQEVASTLFGRLYFGFESSGLGYPSIVFKEGQVKEILSGNNLRNDDNAQEAFVQLCNSTVRLLGEKYRFDQPVPRFFNATVCNHYDELPAAIKEYVARVADHKAFDNDQLTRALTEAINENGHQGWLVSVERMDLKILNESEKNYSCPNCSRIHFHGSAGICTHCLANLTENPNGSTAKNIRANHYYANKTSKNRPRIRLHCEELTGQTDDQPQRQRWFRNIILDQDGSPAKVAEIDILSVTTTMEVGVDIGNLRGVLQANMPPERFNYQQRSGRGGRRDQAYSFVFTLSRNRTHDEFHFREPKRITNDPPPVPFLAMEREQLARRLASKEVLRRAFGEEGVAIDSAKDLNGEFGPRAGWQGHRPSIQNWIVSHEEEINSIIEAILFGNEKISKDKLTQYLKIQLLEEIDRHVVEPTITTTSLSECLAESATLPMFGMPTRTRFLYHGPTPNIKQSKRTGSSPRTIDRDLDFAITDFAPGAQKTKDKRIHTSIGFTPSLTWIKGRPPQSFHELGNEKAFCYESWMLSCPRCHHIESSDSQQNITICPGCNYDYDYLEFRVKTPTAFRTNFSEGQDALEDFEIVRAPSARLAESSLVGKESESGNTTLRLNEGGQVFTLNDNNGKLFKGGQGQRKKSSNCEFNLKEQWIIEDELPDSYNGTIEEIALVSSKITDLLSIKPKNIPTGLNLDILSTGAAVKAAYASAAFVIRGVATDIMDVDPEELDICHLQVSPLKDGRKVGQILISDYHPNGSGFTSWLRNNWKEIINAIRKPSGSDSFADMLLSPNHGEECNDACYECLKNFRNMAYHSLLDWRLGVSIVNVLADSKYIAGLHGKFDSPELEGWLENATTLRDSLLGAYANYNPEPTQWDILPGLDIGPKRLVLTHELWDTSNPPSESVLMKAKNEAEANIGNKKLHFVNPFNIARRPSSVITGF